MNLPFPAARVKRHVFYSADFIQDGGGFAFLRACDRKRARFQDAGFLKRNGRQRIAEKFTMIDGNGGDGRNQRRRNDIGGIVSAAEPHFQNGKFRRNAREKQERRRRNDFKNRDRFVVVDAFHFFEGIRQNFVVDFSS